MLVARAWHCAVACGGCLYVMGGADNSQRYLCSTERCNMQDGQWSPCAPMSNTRYGFAAVVLNGFIYCIGGYDGETWLDSVERYSPDRCMPSARESKCAACAHLSALCLAATRGSMLPACVWRARAAALPWSPTPSLSWAVKMAMTATCARVSATSELPTNTICGVCYCFSVLICLLVTPSLSASTDTWHRIENLNVIAPHKTPAHLCLICFY